MRSTVLARRYAKALFEIALEKGILDKVADELTSFSSLIAATPELRYFFRSPEAGKAGKKALIEKGFNKKFSPLFINFIIVLLDKNRQNILGEIDQEFTKKCDAHYNRVTAKTTSAVQLNDKELAGIRKSLEEKYKATFEVENEVKPDILGGLILQIDGQVIDGSLKGQLSKMRTDMLKATNGSA